MSNMLKTQTFDDSKAIYDVPSDEVSRQKTLEIEGIAAQFLRKNCALTVRHDFVIYNIASVVLEQVFGTLAIGCAMSQNGPGGQAINLNGVLSAIVTLSSDDEAEKEGNINLKIERGGKYNYPEDIAKDLVLNKFDEKSKSKILLDPDISNGDLKVLKDIDQSAQRILQSKYNMLIYQPLVVQTIACVFVTSAIQWLVTTAVETQKPTMYNFNDIIECRCVLKKGAPDIRFVPGMAAKLAIKYDDFTEED